LGGLNHVAADLRDAGSRLTGFLGRSPASEMPGHVCRSPASEMPDHVGCRAA
jgi:hypothetical protein